MNLSFPFLSCDQFMIFIKYDVAKTPGTPFGILVHLEEYGTERNKFIFARKIQFRWLTRAPV